MQHCLEHALGVGAICRRGPAASAVALVAEALAAALEQYPREQRMAVAPPSRDVQRALDAAVARARDGGVRCEQFVIILKSVWYSLPEIRHLPEHRMQREVLQQIVTLAIESYYHRSGEQGE